MQRLPRGAVPLEGDMGAGTWVQEVYLGSAPGEDPRQVA